MESITESYNQAQILTAGFQEDNHETLHSFLSVYRLLFGRCLPKLNALITYFDILYLTPYLSPFPPSSKQNREFYFSTKSTKGKEGD